MPKRRQYFHGAEMKQASGFSEGLWRLVLLLSGHFNDDARNVIARAGVQGQLTQGVGAFLHVGVFLHAAHNLVIGNHAAQSVRAKHELVAGFNCHGFDLGTFTDQDRPYLHGSLGLYGEDSEVHFDNVLVTQA